MWDPRISSFAKATQNAAIRAALGIMLSTAFAFAAAMAQSAHVDRPITGQTPPRVLDGTAIRIGHYESTNMLRLAIVLVPPHQDQVRQLLDDLQNNQSPLYHQFLTADEWNARFAPSLEDEQAVVDWAKSNGLSITHRYPNRLIVDVEATAGTIEKVLGILINTYQDGERVCFSNDRDPVLPASLVPIVESVQGLNSFEAVRPANDMNDKAQQPDYVPGPAYQMQPAAHRDAQPGAWEAAMQEREAGPEFSNRYGLQPSDIFGSQAYNYGALMNLGHCCNPLKNPGGSPKATSIAVAGFANLDLNDVDSFQSLFPYLAEHIQPIYVDGTYTCVNSPQPDGYCIEIALDAEWAMATSNSEGSYLDTAEIYVYEGSNNGNATVIDVYNHILNDDKTRIMTTSWTCAENVPYKNGDCYDSTMVARNHVFSQMAAEGWTLVAASGDEGATGTWCQDYIGIMFPGSDPNLVAAGGSQLVTTNTGAYVSEAAWVGGPLPGSCALNLGGSTGGFSGFWSVASYQSSFVGYKTRAAPDIALNAESHQEIYFGGVTGGELGVGGTSIVAPELAGFFAQENAYLLSIGDKCGPMGNIHCAPLGNPNYSIYEEGLSRDAQHNPFYDITSGCNSNDITAKYHLAPYCAHKGFDQVTGWGSANMLQLAWALNWHAAAANGVPYLTFTGPATNNWYNTNQTVSWKVNDDPGSTPGIPGTGIAGFTQGWDSIPADPTGAAGPGSGNSFYEGPQYPNHTEGCLAFSPTAKCLGSVSQGCHTVHVRGWNNQGWTTDIATGTPHTYGPICYDTVPPKTTAATTTLSGGSVKVTLTATDPGASTKTGSGVRSTFFKLDDETCNPKSLGDCLVYSIPLTVLSSGPHIMYFFSEDKAGNFEVVRSVSFTVD